MRLKFCCAAIAVALALTGCGDDSSSSDTGDQAATSTSQQQTTTVERYDNTLAKPRGPGPHPGARVDQLVIRDVRVGTGPEIRVGDTGVFHFIGVDYITGERLDDSWGTRTFDTIIDKGAVIDGWWQGIPGMRVGGRRQITVPPGLGFTQSINGLQGRTTYFDVVLLEVRPATPAALEERATAAAE